MKMALNIKPKQAIDDPQDKDLHMKTYGKYYEPGVLDYDTHWRLVLNLSGYAAQANIPEYYVYHPAKDVLIDSDLEYLEQWTKLPDYGVYGGVMTSKSGDASDRMAAFVGVMLRNFVDARYITVQDIVATLKRGDTIDSKLVCIPNFALPKNDGGDYAHWEASAVSGWLMNRHSHGYQTVIYASSESRIAEVYGSTLGKIVSKHYVALD